MKFRNGARRKRDEKKKEETGRKGDLNERKEGGAGRKEGFFSPPRRFLLSFSDDWLTDWLAEPDNFGPLTKCDQIGRFCGVMQVPQKCQILVTLLLPSLLLLLLPRSFSSCGVRHQIGEEEGRNCNEVRVRTGHGRSSFSDPTTHRSEERIHSWKTLEASATNMNGLSRR